MSTTAYQKASKLVDEELGYIKRFVQQGSNASYKASATPSVERQRDQKPETRRR